MSKKVTVVVRLISGMADMVNDKKLYYDTVRELLRTEDIRKLRNYPNTTEIILYLCILINGISGLVLQI